MCCVCYGRSCFFSSDLWCVFLRNYPLASFGPAVKGLRRVCWLKSSWLIILFEKGRLERGRRSREWVEQYWGRTSKSSIFDLIICYLIAYFIIKGQEDDEFQIMWTAGEDAYSHDHLNVSYPLLVLLLLSYCTLNPFLYTTMLSTQC